MFLLLRINRTLKITFFNIPVTMFPSIHRYQVTQKIKIGENVFNIGNNHIPKLKHNTSIRMIINRSVKLLKLLKIIKEHVLHRTGCLKCGCRFLANYVALPCFHWFSCQKCLTSTIRENRGAELCSICGKICESVAKIDEERIISRR